MKAQLSKYNNLTQRIIVAILGVAVIISAIYWQSWSYFAVFSHHHLSFHERVLQIGRYRRVLTTILMGHADRNIDLHLHVPGAERSD
jgi:hypothetical protein